MNTLDPNKTILTGENPFIRISPKDGDPNSTNASYWRIIFSPAGPGHVLYLKSELTEDRWRIYSDNIAMARWLQSTVQGMLNAELADTTIPCADAQFSKTGDPRYFWTEHVKSYGEDISLTWFDIGEPLLIHAQPNQIPDRRYGLCTVLIPALGTRLVRNGVEAKGQSWRARTGRAGLSRPRRWRFRKVGQRPDRDTDVTTILGGPNDECRPSRLICGVFQRSEGNWDPTFSKWASEAMTDGRMVATGRPCWHQIGMAAG